MQTHSYDLYDIVSRRPTYTKFVPVLTLPLFSIENWIFRKLDDEGRNKQ